ncbi:hypothetical protein [Limnohabitans sp.]|jgi:hypothetical protein|uniref:hypothetical protein n=1 Tax=Limnohabitans sp. TaxID=1907725 RepID=UPI0033404359
MQTIPLRRVKPGDFIKRKPDAKTVYRRGDYDRATKTYTLVDTDDISRAIYLKATTLVVVGFTY